MILTRKQTPAVWRLAQQVMLQADRLTKRGVERSLVNKSPSIRLLVCQLCEAAGLTVEWGEHYAAWSDSQTGSPDAQKAAVNSHSVRHTG
jgi:hypothetical protein